MSKMKFSTAERRDIFAFSMVHLAFFHCFPVVLALVSLVFCYVQLIVCTIWTNKRAFCMAGVYIATKKEFALLISVWCVRVGHSSRAQCTKNVHPLVLSVFFIYVFFLKTADRMQNPE